MNNLKNTLNKTITFLQCVQSKDSHLSSLHCLNNQYYITVYQMNICILYKHCTVDPVLITSHLTPHQHNKLINKIP